MLSDPALSFLDVRLQVVLKGVGVEIRTNPSSSFSLIHLIYGTPVVFTSADLSDYFLSSNLLFKGMSLKEYEQKGMLSEGLYELKLEVLEVSRNKLMGSASTTFWAMLQDPPLLSFPVTNAQLEAIAPASILFQWQAMHKVYSGFDVEYGLELYEVRTNDSRPINEVVRTSIPIFQTTTTQTSYTYGPTDPVLQSGLRYLWRVQAKTLNNKNEVFKNNGYSQVYAFDWLPICKPPTNVVVKTNPQGMAYVTFDPGEGAILYKVRIRAVQSSLEWIELESLTPSVLINQLALNRLYEVQVSSQCDKRISVYSPSTTFTISSSASEPKSKDPLPVLKLDPTTYLDPLEAVPGTSIKVNYYTMQVKTISYDPQTKLYSGTGKVYHPEFGIWIATAFRNIQINAEKVFVKGLIAMVAKKPTSAELAQVPNRRQPLLCVVEESSSSQANGNVGGSNSSGTGNTNTGNNTSTNGSVNAGTGSTSNAGNPTASSQTNKNDSTQTATNGNNTQGSINTSNGIGGGEDGSSDDGGDKNNEEDKKIYTHVEFKEKDSQQYGFDDNTNKDYTYQYLNIKVNNDNYYIPHKSVKIGSFDWVECVIYKNKKDSFNQIQFISGKKSFFNGDLLREKDDGIPVVSVLPSQVSISNNDKNEKIKLDIQIQGAINSYKPDNIESRVDSLSGKMIGTMIISTYPQIDYKLKIIRVDLKDGDKVYNTKDINSITSIKQIENYLNNVYRQAIIRWQIDEKIDVINVEYDINEDGHIAINEEGKLSDEQIKITSYDFLDPKIFYLFIVDSPKTPEKYDRFLGQMRIFQTVGFIYASECLNEDELLITIAHELGHGQGLWHPEQQLSSEVIDYIELIVGRLINVNSTLDNNNLMKGGNRKTSSNKLRKWQWDILNNVNKK